MAGQAATQARARAGVWRLWAFAITACAVLVGLAPSRAAVAADPAVAFMQKFARDAIAAQASAEPGRMYALIRRYSDLPGIGQISLGDYANRLKDKDRNAYHTGMAKFMARFAVEASKTYRIVTAQVQASRQIPGGYEVDSEVTLAGGSRYEVRWLLVQRGKDIKIRDAQVLGFWMTPFQRDMFVDFVEKNGGKVEALLIALGQ